ncbi:MAG: DNA polymerase III subunit alpha [Bacteroidia bacterium]|nr:DNA polymerase III subunit alpha [Bacteroidia bacterium]
MNFSHLHVHTQYSLLDGAAGISELIRKAKEDNMPAVAITDHGNMFGVFEFVAQAGKAGIKPIVGCEFYVVEDRHKKQFTKDERDKRYHQLFLAKNAEGYKNLVKLCSLGYTEGLYSKYPRIDKELVLQYHKGLIATTCCLGAMVPRTILRKGESEAEQEFKWWLDLFGEDYYIELQRHGMKEQDRVNEILLRWAEKYKVKVIATNDSHYVDQEDSNAHDILLCINTGEKQSTPSSKEFTDDDNSSRGKRFAFFNDQFFFKSTSQMTALFQDVPAAIENTNEVIGKIETLKLKRDILLPHFQVPDGYGDMDAYLRHLTFEGAKKRYRDITPDIEERLNFELFTVKTMGFAGYFLIVADFIAAGRDLGVFVGPGRGSAAGSAVAYCIGITNIDPIKYNLLFERFLNPDRKSMPDIDTDFDDTGRQKVIDYVVNKYGRNQVAHIVTYGTMAAKMSIKDVARVLDLPLNDSNALAKLVPERPGIKLHRVLHAPVKGENSLETKENLQSDEIENVKRLRSIYEGSNLESQVLHEAEVLEGSVRGTGIHAAGIIIAPTDLSDIIPVCASKDTELLITQFEGGIIEEAGVIKMDFLGLKTLSILKDALALIRENHGKEIDLDTIPLDDKKTLELYQRADTNGTFQFESPGMQKYLRDLKPDKFDDLIAMNALFRPGPLAYIPNYINRKHGREKVNFELPEMEEYLKDTYGITVYQEQVMLLSQKLAGFTKGDADTLRKAMGKKQKDVLDKMKEKFIRGATEKGHPEDKLSKIWTDWEAFAQYAFNKSHSTCYAYVAFQTAWLKAHYPAEYMASVLTHHVGNIDKITFFMEECRRMGLQVQGPDINESELRFSVNKKGEIRFGLGAIKGVGEAAVEAIVNERKANGPFKDMFDLVCRINLRSANKKTFESLAVSGAFDNMGNHQRSSFFHPAPDGSIFLEKLLRFGTLTQEGSRQSQNSLFGNSVEVSIPKPEFPKCEPWGSLQQLKLEKDVIGFYLSGHPLDNYRMELKHFTPNRIQDLKDLPKLKGRELVIAGLVSSASHRVTKAGKPFGSFILEDFTEAMEFALFGDDYVRNKGYLNEGYFLHMRVRVQNRFNQPDQFEAKVIHCQLLNDVREKFAKHLTITFPAGTLSEDSINSLLEGIQQNIKKHKQRNCQLRISITDPDDNLFVDFPSRKFRVYPDNELIDIIEKDKNAGYSFNR